MLHKMNIGGLAMDPSSNAPILILNAVNDDFSIPIWIGLLEAASIASVLQNISFDRPMTHDLFKNLTQMLDVQVNRIDICDLKDNTFYAEIHFASQERSFTMDARPSDAIALALRYHAPIFVDERVIEKSQTGEAVGEALDESEEGKKWAEYLEKLSPDDFGKYKV